MLRRALLVLAMATVATPAFAQPAQSAWTATRVDPRIEVLFAHRARTGRTFPAFAPSSRFEREATLPVAIRFASAPSQMLVTTLGAHGVAFHFGARPMISGAYSARVDAAGLAALIAEPSVTHIECDLPARAIRPLDLSVVETRIDAARRAVRLAANDELDGHGVIIGDLDTSVFAFHPALFRADAGISPWIDVNHDGVLTPAIDGVDLDGDGRIAPTEVLHLLHASAFDVYGMPFGSQSTTTFRPDTDWLYLDTNGDRTRNYAAGFQETDPAYGEPLFVADDANHDGRVQLSEHVMRLGTSKLRAVMDSSTYTRGDMTGNGLVTYDLGDDDMAFQTEFHGTGVAGILVSGVPGVSRLLGLAPGADLVVANTDTVGNTMGATAAMQWEVDQGVNVMLTEFAPYAWVALDDSSEEERFLDSELEHNVIPVSPAGNLAQAHKHLSMHLVPGENSFPMPTAAGFDGVTTVLISLHHVDLTRRVAIRLERPNGTSITFPANAPSGFSVSGGGAGYAMDTITTRATHQQDAGYSNMRGVEAGMFVLHLTLPGDTPLDVEAYVADDRTSWGGGFQFMANDEPRTICHPATAAQTMAVAAYVLHDDAAFGPWAHAGERAAYSSEGPRLDSMPGISLAAPDNPLSLLPAHAGSVPAGSYQPFGGTSGAGPHVAAAVALLRQHFPGEDANAIRTRLTTHARHDSYATPEAVTTYGAGKLDLSGAIELGTASTTRPTVVLNGPDHTTLGDDAMLTPVVNAEGAADGIRIRWDFDYDGHPDTDWVAVAPNTVHATALGPIDVRVEVRDANGAVSAGTHRVLVVRALAATDAGADVRPSDGGTAIGVGGAGCSCRAGGSPPARPVWAAWFFALVFAARRRRRGS